VPPPVAFCDRALIFALAELAAQSLGAALLQKVNDYGSGNNDHYSCDYEDRCRA
jgi:hypothetical protein